MKTSLEEKMLNMVITLWGYRVNEFETEFINELKSPNKKISESEWNMLNNIHNKYSQLYPSETEGYLFTL
jgi:hypothetical protein